MPAHFTPHLDRDKGPIHRRTMTHHKKLLLFVTVAGLVSTAQGCGGDDHAAIFLPVPE
jgi:hypothetical protein